jgi:hypothetical protein
VKPLQLQSHKTRDLRSIHRFALRLSRPPRALATGLLHLGHARTFWTAAQRAVERNGQLILRNEDLDAQRCRPEFVQAMLKDLHWLGIQWTEGPDCGGPYAPTLRADVANIIWRPGRSCASRE